MVEIRHADAELFIKLRKLSDRGDEPVADILARAMSQWHGGGEKAVLQIRIHYDEPGKPRDVFNIALNSTGARFQKTHFGEPTLTVVLAEADFRRIAQGTHSPLQAYLDGKLYVRGNVGLGRGVMQALRASGTQTNVCPILVNESWRPDGNGATGTLTISGEFFTHGGLVNIIYNYGSGQYEQNTVADSSGNFTVSQPEIFCGDIPGDPGVGVIVTAFDLNSGQSTKQSYATPCF